MVRADIARAQAHPQSLLLILSQSLCLSGFTILHEVGEFESIKKKVISSADLVSREGPPSCFENQVWIICLGVVEKRIDHRNGDDLPPVHMYTHTYTRVRAHTHTRKCVSPLTPLPTDNYIGFFTWARTSISDFSERWKKKQKTIRMPKRR